MLNKNKLKEEINSRRKKATYKNSQRFIAKKLGISESQLSNIFAGRRKASPEMMSKIEKILNQDLYKIGKN
ncbi:MAG TPA: hypothetical protein DIS94_05070 [Bacteroidetes bacterium]|nr:hypothetical protein [Bacteroidota bacterium]HRE42216.1 helix-turn-helix transcriptional regulator [Ignavibacteria bacterium]